MLSALRDHLFSLREKTELLVLYGVVMFAGGMLLNGAFTEKAPSKYALLSSEPYYEREYEMVTPASVPEELLEEAHQAYLTNETQAEIERPAGNDSQSALGSLVPSSGATTPDIRNEMPTSTEVALLPKSKPDTVDLEGAIVPQAKPLSESQERQQLSGLPAEKPTTASQEEGAEEGMGSAHNLSAYSVTVARGDSLVKILSRNGLEKNTIAYVSKQFNALYDAKSIRAGDKVSLYYDKEVLHDGKKDEAFRALRYTKNKQEYWVIRQADGNFITKERQDELTRVVKRAKGVIVTNLYALTAKLDVPSHVASQAVKAFSTYFDFRRDIPKGTPLEIVYESFYNEDNEKVKDGNLIYASLAPRKKTKRVYRFSPSGRSSDADYFDEQGRLSKRTLMRRPVASGVLSSNYGMRKHPVLKKWMMHKGVDYAAKTGTPIYAAGDGVIDYKGRRGGYGNYIRIRHDSEYKTAYAHLHKYASNMHKGKRVRRGDIIGYVGSTGRSTGPHLHYEILRHGKQVNPLKVKASKVVQLQGGEMQKFKQAREQIRTLLSDFDRKNTTQLVADAGNIQ